MSVPNSHTRIFTTIPTNVRKTWTIGPVLAKDGRIADRPGTRHEHSLINSIKVEVDFNKCIQDGLDSLNEWDESETDAIVAWQEARRGWASLERAISTLVDDMIVTARDRAAQNGMQTVDVLRVQRTDAEKPTYCPSPEEERASAQRKVSFAEKPSDIASTVGPDDSASVITLTQSTLEEMMELMSTKKRHKQKQRAPPSILSYAAGQSNRRRTN